MGYGQSPGEYPPPSYGYPGAPASGGAASAWGPLASWGPRALGHLIDAAITVAGVIAVLIVGIILSQISSALGVIVFVLGFLVVAGVGIWLTIQVGQTGASPGMRVIGLRCVKETTGQPIGGGMGFVRSLAHIVDGVICYVGWLFPLWDSKRQTLADKIMGTVVVTAPQQPFSLAPPAGA